MELKLIAARTFADAATKEEKVLIFDDGTVFLANTNGINGANRYAKSNNVKPKEFLKQNLLKEIEAYKKEKTAQAEKAKNEAEARIKARQALIDEKKEEALARQQAFEEALLKQKT
jgi:hypothetical protein